jgi:DNA repair ATPase RecN
VEKAMTDQSWDEQFKQFLRKTGDDFRRTSEEVRAEAQKLLEAAMDPEKQQRVRDRLNELSLWARKSAQGVAGAMADAATKAETAFHSATDRMTGAAPAETVSAAPAAMATPARKPAAKKAPKAKAKTVKAKAKPVKARPVKSKAKPARSPRKSGGKRKK